MSSVDFVPPLHLSPSLICYLYSCNCLVLLVVLRTRYVSILWTLYSPNCSLILRSVIYQYEAVVTPGNELMIHHILLYRCNIPSTYDGVQGPCYTKDRALPQCRDIILAWAIGGEVKYTISIYLQASFSTTTVSTLKCQFLKVLML